MFENIASFFKKIFKTEQKEENSKTAAKERLQLVLMQDRANVSADFLDLMRQEIIEVIKKYITVDEKEIDVRLINKSNDDGTNGAPALVANIPIVSVKNSNKNIIENNNVKKEIETEKSNEEKDEISETKVDEKEDKEEIENTQENIEENVEEDVQVVEENKKEEAQA